MLTNLLKKQLGRSPIIFSVKDEKALRKALASNYKILFFLYGDIVNIEAQVALAKEYDKFVFVHLDLINGISAHEAAVEFISKYTEADGVISTKPHLLRYAKKFDLATILRIFMLDSMALDNAVSHIQQCKPDLIEILPGIATKSFPLIQEKSDLPLIAGGFIRTKEDVLDAINSGASAVSTTCFELGKLNKALNSMLGKE